MSPDPAQTIDTKCLDLQSYVASVGVADHFDLVEIRGTPPRGEFDVLCSGEGETTRRIDCVSAQAGLAGLVASGSHAAGVWKNFCPEAGEQLRAGQGMTVVASEPSFCNACVK